MQRIDVDLQDPLQGIVRRHARGTGARASAGLTHRSEPDSNCAASDDEHRVAGSRLAHMMLLAIASPGMWTGHSATTPTPYFYEITMRHRLSTVCLLSTFSLIGCEPEPSSESSDFTESTPDARIACNEGDLVLSKSKSNDWEFIATVTDQGVVDWFVEQSERSVEGQSSAGGTRMVDADFPWQVEIEEQEDGTRHLVLRELRSNDSGERYQTSGPPGSSVEWIDGTGLRLSIRNGFMPNSKEVVSYHVGDWTFESCEEVGSL